MVLTGGPGTGKTTTVLRMPLGLSREHQAATSRLPQLRIAAPTAPRNGWPNTGKGLSPIRTWAAEQQGPLPWRRGLHHRIERERKYFDIACRRTATAMISAATGSPPQSAGRLTLSSGPSPILSLYLSSIEKPVHIIFKAKSKIVLHSLLSQKGTVKKTGNSILNKAKYSNNTDEMYTDL